MKIKENAESVASGDLYYDLFDGGYLRPEKFLEEQVDIDKVNNAIKVIQNYLEELEPNELIEEM